MNTILKAMLVVILMPAFVFSCAVNVALIGAIAVQVEDTAPELKPIYEYDESLEEFDSFLQEDDILRDAPEEYLR